MHDALLIAQREYLQRVRSKAFLFTTLAFPLLLGIIFGGGFLTSRSRDRSSRSSSTLVIASNDLDLAQDVRANLESDADPLHTVTVIAPASPEERAQLRRAVEEQHYDGLLWLESIPGAAQPRAFYESGNLGNRSSTMLLHDAIALAVTRRELAAQGLSREAINRAIQPVHLTVIPLKSSRSHSLLNYAAPYIMALVLYFSVIYYGMNVARSVVQEKTSRVFEVLLATTRPQSLMAGKLLGVGAVGLTQIGIWIALALLWAKPAMARFGMPEASLTHLGLTAWQIAFFVLFFLLGFLFYSAVAAGFGACLDSEQEIQQFSFIIVLPMVVCLVLTPTILEHPSGPLAVALSLFPPCTPIVMFLRMSAQAPPAWQVWLSLILMGAAIWAALWIAARIYRIGILMYGKRPTLPEIARWMRYS